MNDRPIPPIKDAPPDAAYCELQRIIEWQMTCCGCGRRVFCVCRICIECPVHGRTCVGTHD
jgi:hypothetical protein